jgi:hypothetical protein
VLLTRWRVCNASSILGSTVSAKILQWSSFSKK